MNKLLYFKPYSTKITILEVNMKRFKITLLVLIVLAISTPVFAQTISEKNSSDFYYTTIRVEKVYPTRFGYIIQYRKGVNNIGRVAVPNEWFTMAGGKAELISLPRGKNWPYMTVFYENGEFSHIRLYVHPWKGHQTWGNMSLSADIKGYFPEGQQDIRIEFE
jgi:hypothetical protein